MADDVDLLILGGGCAGLSLARELAAFGTRGPSTCIIEQRAQYEDDRTWCFWGHDLALLPDLVEHQWPRVQLRSQEAVVTFECSNHPYCMISARRFYADAFEKLAHTSQIRLEKAVSVLSAPRFREELWEVETSAGTRRARWLVDTRPGSKPLSAADAPILWQSFLGQEIVCEAPVFDPACATLMDFVVDDSGRIVFVYVLPFSSTRALIELTVFAKVPVTSAELSAPLQEQIRARVRQHEHAVVRTEQGILPMGLGLQTQTMQARHLQVGLMHGGARASTGYAFQRIQRWAKQGAVQLFSGKPLTGHRIDPPVIRWMDSLFLSLLRDRPDSAPGLFLSMFERSDPAALMRFLSDDASMRDLLSIVAALPARPFIRQISHGLRSAA